MSEEKEEVNGNITEKPSVITFFCTREQKNLFMRAAKGGKLVDWIIKTLTKEAQGK